MTGATAGVEYCLSEAASPRLLRSSAGREARLAEGSRAHHWRAHPTGLGKGANQRIWIAMMAPVTINGVGAIWPAEILGGGSEDRSLLGDYGGVICETP